MRYSRGKRQVHEAPDLVRGLYRERRDGSLHSAIGYITPNDMLAGHAEAIWAERDKKLAAARAARRLRRSGPECDVDWKAQRLRIRRSHTVGEEVMRTPKQRHRYTIGLPAEAMEVLQ